MVVSASREDTVVPCYPVGVHDEKSVLQPYFTIAQKLVGHEKDDALVQVIHNAYKRHWDAVHCLRGFIGNRKDSDGVFSDAA